MEIAKRIVQLNEERVILRSEQLRSSLVDAFKKVPGFTRLTYDIQDCYSSLSIQVGDQITLMDEYSPNESDEMTDIEGNEIPYAPTDETLEVINILSDGRWDELEDEDLEEIFNCQHRAWSSSDSIEAAFQITREQGLDPKLSLLNVGPNSLEKAKNNEHYYNPYETSTSK